MGQGDQSCCRPSRRRHPRQRLRRGHRQNAPNKDNAVRFLEFLVSDEAQALYAKQNLEYPVKDGAAVDPIIAELGTLNTDDVSLVEIAANRKAASQLVDEVGFDNSAGSARRTHDDGRHRIVDAAPGGSCGAPASGWRGGGTALLSSPFSLAAIAAGGSGDAWAHLAANVLPRATLNTLLLLGGVGVLTIAIGTGAAWLVTAYDFPGRRVLDWALLLPLAVPTYIVAFAYLDLLHPIGPVQTLIRDILGIASPRDFRLPDLRSIPGAVILLGFVLYPYVYLSTRALFLMQASGWSMRRAFARRRPGPGLPARAAARPPGDRGRGEPRADGDAQRRRRLGIPRRPDLTLSIYSTWINSRTCRRGNWPSSCSWWSWRW
jgi:hypothetical protein